MIALLVVALAVQTAGGAANLSGTWSLNAMLSDAPEQVVRELQADTGQRPADQLFGDLGGGEERGGGGRGGRGRRPAPSNAPRSEPMKDADQKLLDQLTTAIRLPPTTLTIAQGDGTVTLGGDTIRTDGKTETRQLDGGSVERTAAWEGPQLVIREKIGHAGTLRTMYSVLPATKQLLVRVDFQREGQLGAGPFEIKLVYDAIPK
jgi:hypothetical protein